MVVSINIFSIRELKYILRLYKFKVADDRDLNDGISIAKFFTLKKRLITEGILQETFIVNRDGKEKKAYKVNHKLLDTILLAEEFPELWDRAVNHCTLPQPKPREKRGGFTGS